VTTRIRIGVPFYPDHDCIVDKRDLDFIAGAFGSNAEDSRYNSMLDFNRDGRINIIDLALMAAHFEDQHCQNGNGDLRER